MSWTSPSDVWDNERMQTLWPENCW